LIDPLTKVETKAKH